MTEKHKMTYGIYGPSADDYVDMAHTVFLEKYSGVNCPLISTSDQFIITNMSLWDLASKIHSMHPHTTIIGLTDCYIGIISEGDRGAPVAITVTRPQGKVLEKTKFVANVSITASPDVAKRTMENLEAQYPIKRQATIDWYYYTNGSISSMSLPIENPPISKNEYYPYFGDPRRLFKEYLESSASILFMSGDPGTGKTSLLRTLIYENNLHAMITYDEKLVGSDELFMKFIRHSVDLLIFEDSEEYLKRRDLDNKMMARFLNVSDGLVSLKSKKMIFTTNYREFTDIDEALLRPGRCFGFMQFRKLTYPETVVAAKTANIQVPAEEKEYSLAEMFNQEIKLPQPRKIGF